MQRLQLHHHLGHQKEAERKEEMQNPIPEIIPHKVLEDGSIQFNTWPDAIFYVENYLHSQNFLMRRNPDTDETVVTKL